MDQFEYRFTTHGRESFGKLVYFCSEAGSCSISEVPGAEPTNLAEALNVQGREGWELVQLMFGKDGIIACWKRRANMV
ncbi:MAG: hypothetical protein V2B18_14420 [Pseudomonadota bacterium]|jgi:hypothetical protein